MAPVNPAIQPHNDPSYGRDSRPVDVPDSIRPRGVENNTILPEGQKIGDKSAEFEGQAAAYGMRAEGASTEAFGDLFAGVAKTAGFLGQAGVEMVKRDIENQVYDVANKEREAYTAKLEAIKASTGGKSILDANASADEPQPPADVNALGDRLETLKSSVDAGKIPQSYYEGRLLAEAKRIRAQYPGFRQEIDDAFARVTGSNPANAVVHSLVREINAGAGQANSQQNRVLHYVQQHLGIPGAEQLADKIISGEVTPAQAETIAIKLFAPHERRETEIKEHKAEMDDVNATRDEKSYHAQKLFDKASSGIINNAISGVMHKMGLTDDASVAQVDAGLKNGSIDPKTWEAQGQEMIALKARIRAQIISAADKYGVTENYKGGKKELIKDLDADLSQFETLKDLIYAKDTGTLFHLDRHNAAQLSQDKTDLLRSSKVGPYYRQVEVFRSIGGENYMKDLNLNMINTNIPKDYKEVYTGWAQEITSQTMYGPTGKPATFNDMLNELKIKGIDVPAATKKIMDRVEDIHSKDPKVTDDIKENIALGAFSRGNWDMISKLWPEDVDNKGRPVTGQNAIFQKWTSEETTKSLKALDAKRPGIFNQYVNWAEHTMGSVLLPREIANLNSLSESKDIKFSWDGDNKRLNVKYVRPMPEGSTPIESRSSFSKPTVLVAAEKVASRINSSLSNYKHIADASGQDVDTFMIQTLKNIGVNTSSLAGISADIIKKIDDARGFEGRFGASQRGR